jgi:hypothetical protein
MCPGPFRLCVGILPISEYPASTVTAAGLVVIKIVLVSVFITDN